MELHEKVENSFDGGEVIGRIVTLKTPEQGVVFLQNDARQICGENVQMIAFDNSDSFHLRKQMTVNRQEKS